MKEIDGLACLICRKEILATHQCSMVFSVALYPYDTEE